MSNPFEEIDDFQQDQKPGIHVKEEIEGGYDLIKGVFQILEMTIGKLSDLSVSIMSLFSEPDKVEKNPLRNQGNARSDNHGPQLRPVDHDKSNQNKPLDESAD